MPYATEREAEIFTMPCLASNLSDGMQILSAQNLARPMNDFIATGHPLPERLVDTDAYSDAFLETRLAGKKTAARAMWQHPSAPADVLLYVRRKVWAAKVERMDFATGAAAALGSMVVLQRDYRAGVHEALNHAAKHNEDVKLLAGEIRDAIDAVVTEKLLQVTQRLAGDIALGFPELQAKLLKDSSTRTLPAPVDVFSTKRGAA